MGQWISKKTRLQLVADWRNWWRWISQQCTLVAIGLQTTWYNLPDELRAAIPAHWVTWGTVAVLVLGFFGRLVQQGAPAAPADGQDGGEVGQ